MTKIDTSKQYVFIGFSVDDILEAVADGDYPFLAALSVEKLDTLLARAFTKGWCFWEYDGSLDLFELQRLAEMLYGEEV